MKTIVFFFALFIALPIFSQSIPFDETFGDHGVVVDKRFQGSSSSLAVQRDGKVIIGGSNFVLARYKPDGTPDLEFGMEGIVNHEVLNEANCNDIILQKDGKIIATGSMPNRSTTNRDDAIVVRFQSNGQLDSSFGFNGIVTTDIQQEDKADRIVLQSDGKILITGTGLNDGGETQKPGGLFVVRYLPNGSIDNIFAGSGYVFLTKPIAEVNGLAVDSNDNIYIGYDSSFGSLQYVVLKLDMSGILVNSFGNNGYATMPVPGAGSGLLKNLIIHEESIIATGYSIYKGKSVRNLTLVKYTADGQVDPLFGNGGVKIVEMGFNWTEGNDLEITPNQDIIVAGRYVEAYPSTKYYAALYRFRSNGNLDSTFGLNGYQLNYAAGQQSLFEKLYVDLKGSYIVSGSSYFSQPSMTNYMVSKYATANNIKTPRYIRIKKWLHRQGFTWEDWPGKNINYFIVQRSSNGNAFDEIARLSNRNIPIHIYEDPAPLEGNNYYRLAAVSADGSTTNSNIIGVENNNVQIMVYPNPVMSILQITGLPATVKTKLSITDISGNIRMTIVSNSNSFSWNVRQLPKGNYILNVQYGDTSVSRKFLKE